MNAPTLPYFQPARAWLEPGTPDVATIPMAAIKPVTATPPPIAADTATPLWPSRDIDIAPAKSHSGKEELGVFKKLLRELHRM